MQTGGHRKKVGIDYDKIHIIIKFTDAESKHKFKHLIKKLVLKQEKGLGATSSYEDVFSDYTEKNTSKGKSSGKKSKTESAAKKDESTVIDEEESPKTPPIKTNTNSLFSYAASKNNSLLKQLMEEAAAIHIQKLPASATMLLRMIVEVTLKQLIEEKSANSENKSLDLEGAINLSLNNGLGLSSEQKKVLKEFKNQHLDHLNLAAHANVKPNKERLSMARDCIDQFIKSSV